MLDGIAAEADTLVPAGNRRIAAEVIDAEVLDAIAGLGQGLIKVG